MKLFSAFISGLLLLNLTATSQIRVITGKVIAEDLKPLFQVYIQTYDTTFVSKYDTSGQFRISIPISTKKLIFKNVGFESANINLTDSCNQVEIVLLYSRHYDFISLKKADKLRMKEFKKLPKLHLDAYKKGIFRTATACYEQIFDSYIN